MLGNPTLYVFASTSLKVSDSVSLDSNKVLYTSSLFVIFPFGGVYASSSS